MTRTIAILLLLAGVPAQPVKLTVREELEAQYQKLAAANDRKDIAAIMALKSDTFYTIGPQGEFNDRISMECTPGASWSRCVRPSGSTKPSSTSKCWSTSS